MDLSDITYIGKQAFWEAEITGADLHSCCQIEEDAFYMCPLKFVRFRKNVRIASDAFNNVNMKVAYLPDGLRGYEYSFFCKANIECLVTEIDLVEGKPDRFVDFGSSLKKVTIQEGVKTVNKLLFDSNNLKKLYIPDSVTSFAEGDRSDRYFWEGTIYAPKGSAGEAYAAENQYAYCEHGASDHVWQKGTYWEYDNQVRLMGDICDICGAARNLSFLLNGEEEEPEDEKDVIYQLDENNLDFQGISYMLDSDSNDAKVDIAPADTLEEIVLPDAVKKDGKIYYLTEIGASAFPDTVKSVTISSWISYIDVEAFNECNRLEQIDVDEDNTDYMSANGVLFRRANYSPAYIVKFPAVRTGSYTIPEWVFGVNNYAFYKSQLSEVILGNRIGWIDNYAFEGAKITSMAVPDDTQIGQGIFQKCTLLKWLLIGDNLTYKEGSGSTWIGNGLVSDCTRLEAIYLAGLSKDTTSVDDICENCINLHYVILQKEMVNLTHVAFSNSNNIKKMYIPPTASSVDFWDCELTELAVYGVKGTVAESVAKKHECSFSAIDDCEHQMEECQLCVDGERKLLGMECSICGYLSNMYEVPKRVPEKIPEPTPSPTASPTASPTPSPTASPTPEPTPSPTPEPTPEPTLNSTPEPTASPTPELTASPTPNPTLSPAPELTPTATMSPYFPQVTPSLSGPQASPQPTWIRQVTGFYLSTKDNKTIQIQWISVYGSQSYEIYRKAEKEKEYRKIAAIQNRICQYRDKSVKVNRKYSYKIRVIGGMDSIAKSFSVNGMIKPVYTIKKGKKEGVRYIAIRLKKYVGNRIQIYMKKKGGKYKKIKLKSDRIKRYKGWFKLRYNMKGKTLSFMIRTYRKKGKKKIVSYYSKEKKIRV